MEGVDGVDITGTTFTNNQSIEGHSVPDWGFGIYAADSGFKVRGSPTVNPCPFPCLNTNPCIFSNLGIGVYSHTALTNRPYTIKESEFTGCFVGVRNSSVSGATIIGNDFNLGDVPSNSTISISNNPLNDPSVQHQVGIIFETDISGFECQENNFTKVGTNASIKTIGTISDALGTFNNTIRKNNYTGISIGNLSNGANGLWPQTGLYFECNNNFNVEEKDFFVPDGFLKRDHRTGIIGQPNTYSSAGNKFSNQATDFSAFLNQNNPTQNVVRYFYNSSVGLNQEPLVLEGDVVKFITTVANYCPSIVCDPPCEGEEELGQLQSDYFNSKIIYDSLYSEFNSNPTELIEGQLEYYKLSMDKSTFSIVLHEMYDSTTFSPDSLQTWIFNMNTLESALWLSKLKVQTNLLEAEQIINSTIILYNLDQNQQNDLNNFKSILGIVHGKEVFNLSQGAIDSISNLSGNGLHSSGFGINILTANDYYFPPDYVVGGVSQSINSLDSNKDVNSYEPLNDFRGFVQVYPNPSSGTVLFKFDELNTRRLGTLSIFDMLGRQVAFFTNIHSPSIVKWDANNATKGVFYYQIVFDEKVKKIGKIVLK